jgi:mono/diheme cytochrome c family protein
MTKFTLLTAWGRPTCAAVLVGGLAFSLYAADPPSGPTAATNVVAAAAGSPAPGAAAVRKQLTGAELYSIHCNRCHAERYPTERTAAQWKTIMLHMQVRASLPGKQARLILQYLQENSGR